MNKDIAFLQQWINDHSNANLAVDGVAGTLTRSAFILCFVNRSVPAVTENELLKIAMDLGDTDTRRIKAVSKVESGGSGWFDSGLPKILYERHLFYRYTQGAFGTTEYSNKQPGGYSLDANKNGINDSWEKLAMAVCKDPMAALQSISIGKFQVLGKYYRECGYSHPIDMLWEASRSEIAHYAMLRDYILKVANCRSAFLKLSTNPDDCRALAKAYNGPGYEKFDYHNKLARAMR